MIEKPLNDRERTSYSAVKHILNFISENEKCIFKCKKVEFIFSNGKGSFGREFLFSDGIGFWRQCRGFNILVINLRLLGNSSLVINLGYLCDLNVILVINLWFLGYSDLVIDLGFLWCLDVILVIDLRLLSDSSLTINLLFLCTGGFCRNWTKMPKNDVN